MNLVGWIVAGGLAGWVVGLACADDDAALLVDILVGSLGALTGALFAPLLGGHAETAGFDLVAMLAALGGALVLLAVLRCARWTLPAAPRTDEEGHSTASRQKNR